ncbi:unnamed protein product [Bursaphelenchus okinawaensis]|uniref:Uncharacterized protein n=1 Tax=Bursaphelenchus okinawaensis TaxID=465554 RepID=A0A811LR02_9BILA|nr:unnamed protein product [Bursaphelenchus okinawaensis]CAG9127923.1 unnamed protein product [Bursaphelenchus okinawaensis]
MALSGPVPNLGSPFQTNGMPHMFFKQTGHVENVICSAGRYRLYPIKDRRNKIRKCYIALRSFMCEIYKNSREFDKGEAGRHIIDLRTVFNVCKVDDPVGLKTKIISVMTPSDTFYISIDENAVSFDNFFVEFRDRCREARAERLNRQVLEEEYFSAAWDVEVVQKPKLRLRANDTAGHDDLASRCPHMLGRRRLCVKSASITLFKLDVEPLADASMAENAFCVQDYHDFPLSTVSKYGSQDKYVIIRNGRCSSYGPGDLWLLTESMYMASNIRTRMSELYLEEAEMRRSQGIHLGLPGISDRLIKSKSHRDKVEEHETEIARLEEEHLKKEALLLEEERKKEERERLIAENPDILRQEEEAERKRLEEEKASKSVLRKLFKLTKRSETKDKDKESPRSDESTPASPPKKPSLTGLMSFRLPKSLTISSSNQNVRRTAEEARKIQEKKIREANENHKNEPQEDYTMSMNTIPKKAPPINTTSGKAAFAAARNSSSPTKAVVSSTSNTGSMFQNRISSPNADYMMMREDEQDALGVNAYNFGENRCLSDESCCSPRTQTSSFSNSMQSSTKTAQTNRDHSADELRRYGRNDRAYSLGSRPVKKQRNPVTPPSMHQKKHNSGSGSLNTVGSIKEEDEDTVELGKKSHTDGKINENVKKAQEKLSRLELEERKDKHTELVDMFRNRAHSYESSQSTRKLLGWKKLFSKRLEPQPQERVRVGSNESASSRFSGPRWNTTSRSSIVGSDKSVNFENPRSSTFGSDSNKNAMFGGENTRSSTFGSDMGKSSTLGSDRSVHKSLGSDKSVNKTDESDFVLSGPLKHDSPQSRSRTSSFGKTVVDATRAHKEMREIKRRRDEQARIRSRPVGLDCHDNFLELYSRSLEENHKRAKEAKEKPRRRSFDIRVLTSYRRRKPIIELKRTASDSELVIPSRMWLCLPLDVDITKKYRAMAANQREMDSRNRKAQDHGWKGQDHGWKPQDHSWKQQEHARKQQENHWKQQEHNRKQQEHNRKQQELAMEMMLNVGRSTAATVQPHSVSQPVTPCAADNDYVLPVMKIKPSETMSAKRRSRATTNQKMGQNQKFAQVQRTDSSERLKGRVQRTDSSERLKGRVQRTDSSERLKGRVQRTDSSERLKISRGETHMRQQKSNSASVPKQPGIEMKPRCRTMTNKFLRDDQQPGPSGLNKYGEQNLSPRKDTHGVKMRENQRDQGSERQREARDSVRDPASSRDSGRQQRDSYSRDSYPKDSYSSDFYPKDSYLKDSQGRDSRSSQLKDAPGPSRDSERYRETPRDSERYREIPRDPERYREPQRDSERYREPQRDSERHRDAQRNAERYHDQPERYRDQRDSGRYRDQQSDSERFRDPRDSERYREPKDSERHRDQRDSDRYRDPRDSYRGPSPTSRTTPQARNRLRSDVDRSGRKSPSPSLHSQRSACSTSRKQRNSASQNPAHQGGLKSVARVAAANVRSNKTGAERRAAQAEKQGLPLRKSAFGQGTRRQSFGKNSVGFDFGKSKNVQDDYVTALPASSITPNQPTRDDLEEFAHRQGKLKTSPVQLRKISHSSTHGSPVNQRKTSREDLRNRKKKPKSTTLILPANLNNVDYVEVQPVIKNLDGPGVSRRRHPNSGSSEESDLD